MVARIREADFIAEQIDRALENRTSVEVHSTSSRLRKMNELSSLGQAGVVKRNRTRERLIASALFDALVETNAHALVQGDPLSSHDVLIDGSFSFKVLSWKLRKKLSELDLLETIHLLEQE